MNAHRGFFKIVVAVIVGVLVLAYFQVDVKTYVEHPIVQYVLAFLKTVAVYAWEEFIKPPTLYIWNNIILGYIWPTIESWMPGE